MAQSAFSNFATLFYPLSYNDATRIPAQNKTRTSNSFSSASFVRLVSPYKLEENSFRAETENDPFTYTSGSLASIEEEKKWKKKREGAHKEEKEERKARN